jgi:gliding motility-associated-like protein
MGSPSRILWSVMCSLLLGGAAHARELCTNCRVLVYKENKGQWNKPALFLAQLQNGAIFLTPDNITFLLADTADMGRVRRGHHPWVYKEPLDLTVHTHVFRQVFEHANKNVKVSGSDRLNEYFNYFIGNDHSKWASHVGGFYGATYANLYNNIDLGVTSEGVSMKYNFTVHTGADPADIQISYEGTDGAALVDGNVVLKTSIGEVTDVKPYAYQLVNGVKQEVSCSFALHGTTVSFQLPDGYDKSNDLIIDPVVHLIFSTFSGSDADNFGYSATYDSHGNAYAAGSVFQLYGNYPTTTGAFQTSWAGGVGFGQNGFDGSGTDVGVTKYDSLGQTRIYSTYLGGDHDELPHSVIVNSNDELIILGSTASDNFPVSTGAFQTTFHGGVDMGIFNGIGVHYATGSDIFITHFSADGSTLIGSTYVGGSGNDGLTYPEYIGLNYNYADDVRGEVDVDANGNIFVASTTRSTDFPVTAGAYQTTLADSSDAVVFKMDNNLTHMIWSTYLGGNDNDAAYSLAFDPNGDIYIAGGTISTNFPVTSGVIQPANHGGRADGFIAHLSKNGNTLLQSTYWGSAGYDQAYFVRTDRYGNAYAYGQTEATDSTFIHNAIYNKPNGGQFITKFNPLLDTIIWSTTFGTGKGTPDISPTAFLVDVCNKAYISGWGSNFFTFYGIVGAPPLTTGGLEVTPDAIQTTTDSNDFYVMVMVDDASALFYATYFGSPTDEDHVDGGTSRFDRKGIIYQSACAGCNGQSSFPTTPGVVSNTNNSLNCNNAVFKIQFNPPSVVAAFQSSPTQCPPDTVGFTNLSQTYTNTSFLWSFGDGDTSSAYDPTHIYTQSGVYTVQLIVTDPLSCNFADTILHQVLIIISASTDTLPTVYICAGQQGQIGIQPSADTSIRYTWIPAAYLNQTNVSNPYANPPQATEYTLIVTNGLCTDTIRQKVMIDTNTLSSQNKVVICSGDTTTLTAINSTPGQYSYSWQPVSQILSGATTASPLVDVTQTTTFSVVVTNTNGCSFSDSVRVSVVSDLPSVEVSATPDSIGFGDTTQLHVIYTPDDTMMWDTSSTLSSIFSPDPLAYPKAPTTYWVTVTDSNHCKVRKPVNVYIRYTPCASSNIFVPNAFSPNNDGKNDKLFVRGNFIQSVYFTVYDRWGQKVFETRDQNTGWDGTYRGKKLDPSVYGWYAEGTCDVGEKFFKKGNVTILR